VRIVCVVNPRAGPRRNRTAIPDALHETAIAEGWQVTIVLTEYAGHGTEIARDMNEFADLVVAVGGDGTVREVASGLLGGSAALGIIPRGSGNGLARCLGIPLEYRPAISNLVRGERHPIDVGHVNDIPFFLTASVGFDAQVSHRFAQGGHRRGLIPYVAFGVQEWFRYEPSQIRIVVDGISREESPLLLVVANGNQYGYGAKIAPGVRPDDGNLLLATLSPMSLPTTLTALPRLFNGTIDKIDAYHSETSRDIMVERDEPGLIQVDGEPMDADAVLRISIEPGTLDVWLPPD
jgi:diacylglycerol kinase (ATP)